MKVIKNINNNVSLCLDSQGREVIAFGKGVGFTKPPYEVPLDKIERTFYNVDECYMSVIADISSDIIRVTTAIVDYANSKLDNRYSTNVIITLADHIQFAIKREKENINIKLPLLYEIQHLYPQEMEIGYYALDMINEHLNVELCQEEAASIVLRLIDYDERKHDESLKEKELIKKCCSVVEQKMEVVIDKKGFNYYRFVQHMHFLLERVGKKQSHTIDDNNMFISMKEKYPSMYECTVEIEKIINADLNQEELLYLILHVNRLCAREDCYL